MRNILKTATLESKFPVLSVERGCILSKDADVTVGFKVRLPELFTLTSAEYAAMHGAWVKAIKVLPCYTVVHRQDWFLEEKYRAVTGRNDMGFLDRSFELHFNERPFLNHYAYLFITRTTRERSLQQSNFSILYRGAIIPREVRDREAVVRFMESVDQFERIMGDSGLVGLERLTTDEIVGTGKRAGIIEKYFSLSQENTTTLKDISLSPAEMRIGDEILSVHTLSDADDLPAAVRTDGRFEKYSTDRSDCRLSFAAPVGLMLSHNHIYNQYVFMDDPADTLQRLEKTARNMQSLSRYSRANQINRQWIEEYLNETLPLQCHVLGGQPGKTEECQERHRFGTGPDGLQAPVQHRGRADPLLGCHSRRRGGFSGGGVFPYVHRAGGMSLHRGDELCVLSLAIRHQDGGPAQRQAPAPGHLGRTDETGHHHEPQQIHPGAFGQRQVLLHQPSCAQLL